MTRQPSASGRIAVTFSVKRTTREPVSAAKSTEALAGALSVVGTRSAFLVLREAFYGTSRFGGFVQRTGLSEPIAAANLRQLVDEGLLERTDYRDQGRRTRQGYRLTAKGADLIPALLALMQWGDRWLFRGRGPVEVRHRDCAERVTVQLRCTAGHHVAFDQVERTSSSA